MQQNISADTTEDYITRCGVAGDGSATPAAHSDHARLEDITGKRDSPRGASRVLMPHRP